MAEIVISKNEPGDEDKSTERALGAAEANIEHQEEQLEEHAGDIESLKGDREWLLSQIASLREELRAATGLPIAEVEGMRTEIARLAAIVEKPVDSVESSTALPEITQDEKPEEKRTQSILDRLF